MINKKIVLYFLSITVILLICWTSFSKNLAVVNQQGEGAVAIKSSEIEASTLVVGTHLIHLSVLNDELYDIASQSAVDSQQNNLYYKSELADNAWFDITNGSSIADITTSHAVTDDLVESLYLEYYTKSDGITYDLRTNQPINIFDIEDPYDMSEMSELQSVQIQLDILEQTEELDFSAEATRQQLEEFFQLEEMIQSVAEIQDDNMDTLFQLQLNLVDEGVSDEQIEMLNAVMKQVDDTRKAAIFEVISTELNEVLDRISGSEVSWADDEDETFVSVDSVVNAVADSVAMVEERALESGQNTLEEGTSVISQKEYEYKQDLIQAANSQNYEGCEVALDKLIHLNNIVNGDIVHLEEEYLLLIEDLLPASEQMYKDMISVSENEEYQNAAAQNSALVVLDTIISDYQAEIDIVRNEQQYLLSETVKRTSADEGVMLLSDSLSNIGELKNSVEEGAFMEASLETIDRFENSLESLFQEVTNMGDPSSLDLLYEDKEALIEEKLVALDQENLERAEEIDLLLEEKDEEISSLQEQTTAELLQLTKQKDRLEEQLSQTLSQDEEIILNQELAEVNADIASVTANISDGNVADAIQSMVESAANALAELANGGSAEDLNEVQGAIEALGSMIDISPTLAGEGLKDIYQELASEKFMEETDQYDELLEAIEEQLAMNIYTLSDVTEQALNEVAKEVLGVSLAEESDMEISGSMDWNEEMSKEQMASAVLGMEMYYEETQDEAVLPYLNSLVTELNNMEDMSVSGEGDLSDGALGDGLEDTILDSELENNAMESGLGVVYLYERLKDSNAVYVPVETIAEAINYRYIWSDTKKTAIISKGGTYYEFRAFSPLIQTDSSTDTLEESAQFQSNTVYIPREYLNTAFGLDAMDIPATNVGMIVSFDVMELGDAFFQNLLGQEADYLPYEPLPPVIPEVPHYELG